MSKHMMSKERKDASLPDPAGILVGNGKYLRMVKVRKAADIRPRALAAVIASAVALDGGGPVPKRVKVAGSH